MITFTTGYITYIHSVYREHKQQQHRCDLLAPCRREARQGSPSTKLI